MMGCFPFGVPSLPGCRFPSRQPSLPIRRSGANPLRHRATMFLCASLAGKPPRRRDSPTEEKFPIKERIPAKPLPCETSSSWNFPPQRNSPLPAESPRHERGEHRQIPAGETGMSRFCLFIGEQAHGIAIFRIFSITCTYANSEYLHGIGICCGTGIRRRCRPI